jgi:FkbH-like protein
MNIKEMSLLVWGEHCVECAAPSCFQSCDLYVPRPDKRCRRFAFGAAKNRNFSSARGYGVEITFKKWAKLEAYANLALWPLATLRHAESLLEFASPAGNAIGNIMGNATGKLRWHSATHVGLEELVRRLDRGKAIVNVPDAFLLEVYNPRLEEVCMQVCFSPVPDSNLTADAGPARFSPGFMRTVTFPTGYSRHEIEFSLLRSMISGKQSLFISMIPEGDSDARLIFLTADFVRYTNTARAEIQHGPVKCVVWDLDNTVWSGIVMEGDDVRLRPGIADLLKFLDERGILLSVASKSDHELSWRKLQELGIADYFLYPQINWQPKSQNIKRIAEQLNIGIDTFAFVDDNPFELGEVSTVLPHMICINAGNLTELFSNPRFQGSSSAEARQRRQLYREAISRETAEQDIGLNYLEFLATCGTVLEISSYSAEDAERVAELVQRTNQLNFSGHKYTRPQLDEILRNPALHKFVLRSSDKYGSYGTIGFSIVEHAGGWIQVRDLMLSCRVQNKCIEQAFFHYLFERHNPQGVAGLWVNFRHTERNKPARQVMEALGFQNCANTSAPFPEGMVHFSADTLHCDVVEVRGPANNSQIVPVSGPSMNDSGLALKQSAGGSAK